ncbi:MAG: hypothetical protein ACLQQB_04275 [Solirubrobacteraceae bacterium]
MSAGSTTDQAQTVAWINVTTAGGELVERIGITSEDAPDIRRGNVIGELFRVRIEDALSVALAKAGD